METPAGEMDLASKSGNQMSVEEGGGKGGKGDIDNITEDIGPGEIFKHFV